MSEAAIPVAMPLHISSLPFDITDLILCHVDSSADLLSLALISKDWNALIIPRHIEYRKLRINMDTRVPHVWAHLAERSDLAKNIRQVDLLKPDGAKFDRLPRTLLSASSTSDAEDLGEGVSVVEALKNMTLLESFTWHFPFQSWSFRSSGVATRVFDVLRQSKTLRTLNLQEAFVTSPGFGEPDFPLWKVADLEALSLTGLAWPTCKAGSNLTSMLSLSNNLQSLTLWYDPASPSFTSCRFPHLRSLRLSNRSALGEANEDFVIEFLVAHPTIRFLEWYPPQETLIVPGFLPALQKIVSSHSFVRQFLHDTSVTRKLSTVCQISLGSRTMQALANLHAAALEELYVWRFATIKNIDALGRMFPNITLLELPNFGLARPQDENEDYSVDDYIYTLSGFPNLRILQQTVIWQLLSYGRNTMALERLTRWCPKLERLTFNRVKAMEVVLIRDVENHEISWIERPFVDDSDDL